MNETKLLWAYMLANGSNGEPSYYGSIRFEHKDPMSMVNSEGVDWNNTASPYTTTYTEFDGTDSPSSRVEYLVGNLVLKNGKRMKWSMRSSFTEFVKSVTAYINEVNTNPLYQD